MIKKNKEFERFDNTMRKLISVPHSDIKAKLDAEKKSRRNKRKAKKHSASGRASNERD
jgi:hypothetical protein